MTVRSRHSSKSSSRARLIASATSCMGKFSSSSMFQWARRLPEQDDLAPLGFFWNNLCSNVLPLNHKTWGVVASYPLKRVRIIIRTLFNGIRRSSAILITSWKTFRRLSQFWRLEKSTDQSMLPR